jgi:hypothetical protein
MENELDRVIEAYERLISNLDYLQQHVKYSDEFDMTKVRGWTRVGAPEVEFFVGNF